MMALRLALTLWLTAVCFLYQAYWIVLPLSLLLIRFSKKHIGGYLLCALIVFMQLPRAAAVPDTFQGQVTAVKDNAVIVRIKDQSVLIYNVSGVYDHDTIAFEGSYQAVTGYRNFHLFNYETYLNHQNIRYQLYATKAEVLKRSNSLLAGLQQKIEQQKNPLFQSLAKQMLLQFKEDPHPLLHTLQSSGMHLSSLVRGSDRILSLLCTGTTLLWSSWLIPFLLLLCFGPQIAVLRILLSHGLRYFPLSRSTKTGLLMIILLLLRPGWATGLAFIFPMTFRIASIYRLSALPMYWFRQLLSIPMLLASQFQVTLMQLVLFPLLRHLFAWLYAGCFVALLFPVLQTPLVAMYQLCVLLIDQQAWLAWGITGRMSVLLAIIWVGVICSMQSSPRKAFYMLLALVVLHFGLLIFQPFARITFLDVGQGDATLIELPFRQGNILIDTGGHPTRDIAEAVLVPYLHSKGITKLDLVILTHEDVDHSGAYEALAQKVKIKQTIKEKQSRQGSTSQVQIGPAVFQLLLQDHQYQTANDNGLIIFLELYEKRLLFMGDVGIAVEHDLRKKYELLQVDYLHVGHHGSNTSTSKEFLLHTQPAMAVISSGRKNRYGHPHQDVIQRLTKQNIKIVDTQDAGSIVFYFSKFIRFYRTYAEHFGIINAVI